MRAVLPGKPQAKLQALDTVQWRGRRIIAYISGKSIVILGGPHELIQTIHDDGEGTFRALAIDKESGKIAVAGPKEVAIYQPFGIQERALKWSLGSSIPYAGVDEEFIALSWGSDAELLIGGSSIQLFETNDENRLIWSRTTANATKFATFSPDASMLATSGAHDRLPKIWRRQAFGASDTRFDFLYLPHPATVNSFHWRNSRIREHHVDNVLFSVCSDDKIRIWAVPDPHGLHNLQFWAEIDMLECLQPRLPQEPISAKRYAFFLDGQDFANAIDQASGQISSPVEEVDHIAEHLREISKMSPEICIVVDGRGNMSAWGMDNIGHGKMKPSDIFNIAHVDNFNLPFLHELGPEVDTATFITFASNRSEQSLVLLVHHFDGRIIWFESQMDQLFNVTSRTDRLVAQALWTGHEEPVRRIIHSRCGKALMSYTHEKTGLMWKHGEREDSITLTRSCVLMAPEHIHGAIILEGGSFIALLYHSRISIWDARAFIAAEKASRPFKSDGQPMCLVQLPNTATGSRRIYLATVTSKMKSIVWAITLPADAHPKVQIDLRELHRATLQVGQNVFVSPMYPAATVPAIPNTFHKDVVATCTFNGTIATWAASIVESEDTVNWLRTSTTETNITNPALVESSSDLKTAVVYPSKSRLTIWDTMSEQLEYDVCYDSHEIIQGLAWSGPLDHQPVLAAGFPYKVLLLVQLRFDYLRANPAWATVREISIRELTSHPIGDSAWLGSGSLVIGAGNQLFVYDDDVQCSGGRIGDLQVPFKDATKLNLCDLVRYLNGALPVFHPQFLRQCISAGHFSLVCQIIIALNKMVKFSVSGDEIQGLLSIPLEEFYLQQMQTSTTEGAKLGPLFTNFIDEEEPQSVTEDVAQSLNETLASITLPALTGYDQKQLSAIIDCVATAEKHRRSMDDFAMRYFLTFSQHTLGADQDSALCMDMKWREIAWAFHSESQDILTDLVSRQYNGKMLWQHARETGLFMWMTDLTALRSQFETIARNEYTKTDERDPINCSLFYLALRKKNVLIGLWRMATWHREQASTQRLLKNDFTEARWRTAALKNAYALLSKRRFSYAAAFFILAGRLQDAVGVCAQQMNDLQLAIAVARVHDGDDSDILRSLITDKILPQAAAYGNRWLAMWGFWMLGRKDIALRSLVSPVDTTIIKSSLPASNDDPDPHSPQSYLRHDPALVTFYRELRDRTLSAPSTFKDALPPPVSAQQEWKAVLQTARTYRRMGCDLLALNLLRNWTFLPSPRRHQPFNNNRASTLTLTSTSTSTSSSRANSPVPAAADAAAVTAAAEEEEEEEDSESESGSEGEEKAEPKPDKEKTPEPEPETKPKPGGTTTRKPTTFVEPDAGSLLDNFGF